jgi:hypothetical protein
VRWWQQVIEIALRTRHPEFGPDALEADLITLERERCSDAGGEAAGRENCSPLQAALASANTASSLWWPWWSQASDGGTPSMFDGLPRDEQFIRLIRPG